MTELLNCSKKLLWIVLFLPFTSVMAADDLFYTATFSNTAAGGYDVVSYFQPEVTSQGPKRGDPNWRTEYGGVTWHFSSQENLNAFLSDPARYVPQYGGYCAWAVSQGYTAKGDPQHWSVVDGKLYLNYNASVKKTWEQDIPGNIRKGDANWPSVLK